MNKTGHFNFAENRTFLLCLDIFFINLMKQIKFFKKLPSTKRGNS
ncbi:MAG: hypothetical protein ACOX2F_00500 [bacterium]